MANAPVAEIQDLTKEDAPAVKNPKFELYADKKGETRFRLKAKNGQVICSSEGYKSMAAAKNGIKSVAKNAPDAKIEFAE